MHRVRLHVQRPQALRVSVGGLMYDRGADVFDGPYIVVPDADGRTLPTAGRRMAHDLDVAAIPFLTAANDAGGVTATIAS